MSDLRKKLAALATTKAASVGEGLVSELIQAAKQAGAAHVESDTQTGELKLATYGRAGWAAAHKRFNLKG